MLSGKLLCKVGSVIERKKYNIFLIKFITFCLGPFMNFVLKIDVLDAAKKAAQNWNLAPLEKYVDFGFLSTTTYITNYLMGAYFFTF